MLVTQTMEKLRAMRLDGMAQALEEQGGQADIGQLDLRVESTFWSSGNGSGKRTELWRRDCAVRR